MRCLAFTHTDQAGRHALFGLATPRNVRFALAQSSPWLEAAWAHAYDTYFHQPGGGSATIGPGGALTVGGAVDVAREFLDKVQAGSPAPGQEEEWLLLPGPTRNTFEHTAWVSPQALDDTLDGVIDRVSRAMDDPMESPQERTRRVMLQRGPFVGLVDSFGRLLHVVDRLPLVEATVRLQFEADLAATGR